MYYVMIRCSTYAAGAHKMWVAKTRAQAERIARELDTPSDGQPMGRMFVLSKREYDDWFKKNVAPLYRNQGQGWPREDDS